ncbi:hypothetical protein PCL_08584 [Purpureocillium lilacinum]|uniref:Uncharacterized protein n=1 Tax=Purpureocillium lilacinum TaxID=33203 RepID=A0A2U3DRC4_PURLI|nr:hypothetical protein PCL_08584 [Purpureocillium lilacinum]
MGRDVFGMEAGSPAIVACNLAVACPMSAGFEVVKQGNIRTFTSDVKEGSRDLFAPAETRRLLVQWRVAKFSGHHPPNIANLLDVVVVVLATSNVIHIQRAL